MSEATAKLRYACRMLHEIGEGQRAQAASLSAQALTLAEHSTKLDALSEQASAIEPDLRAVRRVRGFVTVALGILAGVGALRLAFPDIVKRLLG